MTKALYVLSLPLLLVWGCSHRPERDSATIDTAAPPQPAAAQAPEGLTAEDGEGSYSKPDEAKLREELTPQQFEVTQRDATEAPFRNEYWDHHGVGLYVDVVTGEPLFASFDKFDSGTGWPSFTKPIDRDRVVERRDESLGVARTEVRSNAGDSHLGHLFEDGPAPTGKRYCINSASLRFVPLDQLEAQGYGAYLPLFEDEKTE